MRCYRVSKSTSTATATTATATATSVSFSGGSQPESEIDRHYQGSFVGLLTTVHTPESMYIPAADRYAGLRPLAEISTQPQIDPFETLATYQTVSLNDNAQEQSASSLSLPYEPLLPNEPSQATDDVDPIMAVAEPYETGISKDPKRPSGQNLAHQSTDSTDKWITYSGDKKRPFKCGYEGCGKTYTTKRNLQKHFVSHIGCLQFRCYTGDCTGAIRYCDKQALERHIHKKHTTERPYECDICNNRFSRSDILLAHRRNVHSVKDRQNQPQNSDSTDKWIMYSGDETRPLKCGYESCGKTYIKKQALRRHLVSHIGGLQFRCYLGECNGTMRYCDNQALTRHIHKTHNTFVGRPFKCDICTKRFSRRNNLKHHKEEVHFTEKEQTTKKEQKSPTKRKRK